MELQSLLHYFLEDIILNDHVNNRKNLKLYRSSEGFPLLSKNMVAKGRRNSNCYPNAIMDSIFLHQVRKWIYCWTSTQRIISSNQVYIRSRCKGNCNTHIYEFSTFASGSSSSGNSVRSYFKNTSNDKKPHDFWSIQRVGKQLLHGTYK